MDTADASSTSSFPAGFRGSAFVAFGLVFVVDAACFAGVGLVWAVDVDGSGFGNVVAVVAAGFGNGSVFAFGLVSAAVNAAGSVVFVAGAAA